MDSYYEKTYEKLREIESKMSKVAALINTVKNSCDFCEYTDESIVLEIAIKMQFEAIEELSVIF